jgi:septal ring factor EnvC (AmiA/AmiB activator)
MVHPPKEKGRRRAQKESPEKGNPNLSLSNLLFCPRRTCEYNCSLPYLALKAYIPRFTANDVARWEQVQTERNKWDQRKQQFKLDVIKLRRDQAKIAAQIATKEAGIIEARTKCRSLQSRLDKTSKTMETQLVLVKHLQEAKQSLAEPLTSVTDDDDDGDDGEVVGPPGIPVPASQEMVYRSAAQSSMNRWLEF